MNLKARIEIVPLLRTKTHCITVCRDLQLDELQNRLNLQCSYNGHATEVNISQNRLEVLPKLPERVQVLTARSCQLRALERVFGEQLLVVDLSGNRLTAVPRFESKQLHTLVLKDNLIQILDKSLLSHPLRRLQLARNRLRTFYVKVLRMPYTIDLELLEFIDVGRVRYPNDSYQSLDDIIEQSAVHSPPMMMRKAIDLQYTVMLRYLLTTESFSSQEVEKWLQYCAQSNLNDSLKELLEGLTITEGYLPQRISFLNTKLFRADRLQAELFPHLRELLDALSHYNKGQSVRCEEFLKFVYANLNSLLIDDHQVQLLIECGSLQTLHQLLHHQRTHLSKYGAFIAKNLLGTVLDYDDPILLYELLAIPEFHQRLFSAKNQQGPLALVDPTCKLHRHLVRERKRWLHDRLNIKTLRFREYEPNNNNAVKVPRISVFKPPNQPEYLRQYELINTVSIKLSCDSFPTSASKTPCSKSSIFEQENASPQRSPIPLSKQISDRLKKSVPRPQKSMSSMVVEMLSKTTRK